MRVLVTWASRRGGTAGVGQILAEELAGRGFDVAALPAHETGSLEGVDAVIVGGALYGNRWPRRATRFVNRHMAQLRKVPVWFFSSGPLDESADGDEIPPTTEVAVLAERVGANGHVTFGGRLEPAAKGFPARAMATKKSGDWRNPERIRTWAAALARELPNATPGRPIDHPAHSIGRLLNHGLVGWALCAAATAGLLRLASGLAALVIHAIVAPSIFAAVAWHYFRARGARDPLPTAIAWTSLAAALDLAVIAVAVQRSLRMFESIAGTWLPFALIFAAVWITGTVAATVPGPERRRHGG